MYYPNYEKCVGFWLDQYQIWHNLPDNENGVLREDIPNIMNALIFFNDAEAFQFNFDDGNTYVYEVAEANWYRRHSGKREFVKVTKPSNKKNNRYLRNGNSFSSFKKAGIKF